jgi:FAD/FMN-containing dehydrogenase/Fe-S oxidoreductase
MKNVSIRPERVRTDGIKPINFDAKALADELRTKIRGEVGFDAGTRALYTTDGSNYRQVPIGVVRPMDVEEVIETVAACRRYGAPLLARGGGTSLAGQGCNAAVVIDMSKYMNKVIEIDADRKLAKVQPGTILDHLRNEAEHYNLTFGPDPATHAWCTLGGMIGNNSCGTHSVMAGKMDDNTEELDILTYDGLRMRVGRTSNEELERIIKEGGRRGEIYARLKALRDKYADLIRQRYPDIPRRVSGYSLDQLLPENGFHVARALVGTEGTCVTVLEATARLVHSPQQRSLLVLGYSDAFRAADHVMEILAHGPIGLEGFDAHLISNMRRKHLEAANVELLPEGGGWLLVEFGSDSKQEADDRAHALMEELKHKSDAPTMKLFTKPEEEAKIWAVREAGLPATVFVPGDPLHWEGWEDAGVPPAKLGDYLRDLFKLLDRYDYNTALYGHFGQGCVHTRINFDLYTRDGIKKFRSFMEEAADLVVGYGGSLAGEHGDGQARAELLPKMYGPELVQAFREFKTIWDPDGKMNPHKVVDPYRMDENLRLGTQYNPPQLATHFKFPGDNGSFATATLRCVGVGKCRRTDSGTMCPSYMVTLEEKHTTRGRTHTLFEMLQGQVLTEGWRDEKVKEALDLCLACKGCKGECPVNVDMATYKAEFLSHYYQGRLRPASSYAMGLIYWWARLASRMPAVANFFMEAPGLGDLAKLVLNVAPQRKLPVFASETFKEWFRQRGPRNQDQPRVILWPDTFNNYFHPETARAAVEVLEAAGYQVEVPEQSLCCGRPLYDHGMLTTAERLLRQILDSLDPQIRAGIPIVGLEPSCIAVFRDELTNLFPNDENAQRLSKQAFLLSEFLEKEVPNYQPPQLQRKAVVHGHCHHKSIMGMGAEQAVLKKLGLDYQLLDSGCCGMAGAFGFEKAHYDVSMKCGERVLLPAVRNAEKDTLIITNGFSCREQIAQTTDRQALHLAQVIQMALHEDTNGLTRTHAEVESIPQSAQQSASTVGVALVMSTALLIGGALIWLLKKSRAR